MIVRRYQKSSDRQEERLLPPRIEDYVTENNPVRLIDAYVDTLDLEELGFKHTQAIVTRGQPPYNPAAFLKLYLYGYINGIRSSRKLEAETRRNIEVIWLLEEIKPSHKTIANFRKDNSSALKAVNRDFIIMSKELNLLGGEEVAVDGSFFKGDSSKQSIYTEANLDKQLEILEKKINAYQKALDEQDATDDKAGKGSLIEDEKNKEKIEFLKEKQAEKKALQEQLKQSEDPQISTTDEDARLMSKRGQSTAGYNVQIAVDNKHKMIVAEETTQARSDKNQLAPMLEKAQEILQSNHFKGYGDSGYHNGIQLKACEDMGIEVYVAIPNQSSTAEKQGRFSHKDFDYDKENNHYTCPQGNTLTAGKKPRVKDGKNMIVYRSKTSDCNDCPLRSQCLSEKSTVRKIERWEHQAVVERHQKRMKNSKGSMRKRGAMVEHPFGTLKHRAGMNHFLMRGLEKCSGEFSLMVLGYNFTRAINILGVDFLRDYCARRQENGLKNAKYA